MILDPTARQAEENGWPAVGPRPDQRVGVKFTLANWIALATIGFVPAATAIISGRIESAVLRQRVDDLQSQNLMWHNESRSDFDQIHSDLRNVKRALPDK